MRLTSAPFLTFAPLLLLGCDLTNGLKDLGDSLVLPDASLLDAPGRKVADGTFRNLLLDGSLEKGGYVMAFRTDLETESLLIVPFLEGNGCEIPGAVAFERVSSKVDVALPGLVAVEVKEGETSRLRFVGFDCKDRLDSLEDSAAPRLLFPLGEPTGALTLTRKGVLYFVEPEAPKMTKIREGVTSGQVSSTRLFLLTNGKIEVYETNFKKLTTLGDGVSSYVSTGGSGLELVYSDSKGLHAWSKEKGDELLTPDGCNVWVSPSDPSTIAYHSPCASRRLVVEASGTRLGSKLDRVRLLGPENIALDQGLLERFSSVGESFVSAVSTSNPGATAGDLVVLRIPEIGNDESEVELGAPEVVESEISLVGNLVYKNRKDTIGDLYNYEEPSKSAAATVNLLAPKVGALFGSTYNSSSGVLANFDGSLGELWSFFDTTDSTNPVHKVLGKKVPRQFTPATETPNESAFVGNMKGDAGEIFLVRNDKATSIGPEAYPDTLRYLAQPKAIAYLRPTSRSGVRLSAYLLESDLTVDISNFVNEYRGVPWPSPGILYATSGGEDDGLWFAKAR